MENQVIKTTTTTQKRIVTLVEAKPHQFEFKSKRRRIKSNYSHKFHRTYKGKQRNSSWSIVTYYRESRKGRYLAKHSSSKYNHSRRSSYYNNH